jgi:hypothetical protein
LIAANVRIGDATTGNSITTGTDNILIGDGAGSNLTGGDNNIVLGDFDVSSNNANNEFYVGYGATAIISSSFVNQPAEDETIIESIIYNGSIPPGEFNNGTFDIVSSVTVSQVTFTVNANDLSAALGAIANSGKGNFPALNSGLWYITSFGDDRSLGIFPRNRARIVGFSQIASTITVDTIYASQINRTLSNTLSARFSLQFVDQRIVLPDSRNVRAVGINTNTPRYTLDVQGAKPELANIPTAYVDGSVKVTGNVKVGDGSITLYGEKGLERISIGKALIGVSTDTSATLATNSILSSTAFVENLGIGTNVVSVNVTVGLKTDYDLYHGVGSSSAFLFDNAKTPYFHATPGKVYRFKQSDSSNAGNLLKFYTDQTKTTEVTLGVTTSGVSPGNDGSYVELEMHMDTGAMFYYESENGTYMGNAIIATISNNMTGISTMKFTDIDIRGKIYDNNGSVGAAGSVLSSTGSGVEWTTVASGGGGSGEFNTGITSTVQIYPKSYEYTEFTFPSTSGKRYVIDSINVANVATGNTSINIITSIDQGDKSYIGYNTPIVSGGLVDLLKQPLVAEPSAAIKVWSNNFSYVGSSNIAEMYLNYTEYDDTDYFSVGVGTAGVATTSITGIFTSSTYPSMLQSIRLTNRTDTGDYPISVIITNGLSTTYLAKDLLIPRYASVEILDRPKRMELNGKIEVKVEQTSTIDVFVSGKKISS